MEACCCSYVSYTAWKNEKKKYSDMIADTVRLNVYNIWCDINVKRKYPFWLLINESCWWRNCYNLTYSLFIRGLMNNAYFKHDNISWTFRQYFDHLCLTVHLRRYCRIIYLTTYIANLMCIISQTVVFLINRFLYKDHNDQSRKRIKLFHALERTKVQSLCIYFIKK